MAKILKYVLGLDGANRFDSFFSVGAPAQDFKRYSAVDNRDDHVTDAEFDSKPFLTRYGKDPSPVEKGCTLSHYYMWKDFLASDADWALIAEDDILISPDLQPVVERIIEKYPHVQMVNLCDIYASEPGKLNPQVDYPRLSLFAPFVYGKYRMGSTYRSKPLHGTGLYLLSRSGAERLVECFGEPALGVVADDFTLYREWGVGVYLVQPGLCGWEGSSVILETGKSHLKMLTEKKKGENPLDRLRIALALKTRLKNVWNALYATFDEVKQHLGKVK
ncbi:glycosyltransferase family 25 protein [Rothia sp. 27098_8_161]|uniref:glycosyltransferase family 25 protein n=1 Tax=Rothia sp. 27098_8_161 TaxID=3003678 RepID=UPI00352C547E